MTEIIPFPRVRRTASPGGRLLTVGVETGLVAVAGIPTGIVRMDSDVHVRYVPTWELTLRNETADLWVGSRSPTAAERRVVLETIAGDVLEQDGDGRLWMNSEQLDPGTLIEVGSAADTRSGPLCVGDAAAFLFGLHEVTVFRFTVHVTPPVLWIFEQPHTLARAPVLDGWTRAAHRLWRDQDSAG